MRRSRFLLRGCLAAALWVAMAYGGAQPQAVAAMGGALRRFESWLPTIPYSSFKRLRDAAIPGVLFAGRIGGYDTIVRVWVSGGVIVAEKVEVELPADRSDEIAISIIARFFREFTAQRSHDELLWRTLQNMKGTILRSGRRETSTLFQGAELSLHLDTQPNRELLNPERRSWGTLFWLGVAKRVLPIGKRT